MPPTVKNIVVSTIMLATGVKEWISPNNVFRLVLVIFGGLFIWMAARLFMYESTYASPNIRDWAAILSLVLAIFMFAAAFPRGWAHAQRFFKL